ncbi:hypothetical protein CEUSTIGMA_g9630.t1 [Chlamydomonas eustigma]|uniref:Uncharacterized protein n=1 Tax=Chlamydomonas eustigma TaxID=1157962 RepID=A0A250XH04_9CHLO|nr:hypothetical protein CEUSTIGMA_g9630.t1 [Chlamydomonas eustigma]|eukprot:GAX82202.1 hypothetical protein CEUSTIGMA_g9630.t1 [Chlamydomonas eustigma]
MLINSRGFTVKTRCLVCSYGDLVPFACRKNAGSECSRYHAARSKSYHGDSRVKALGFDFGDVDHENEKSPASPPQAKLSTLSSLSASLLVFSSVFKGSVGEAFLSTLSVLNKYQASNKEVVSAYTKFYSLLLQSGFNSWEEYLLDQILLGRENAFARAVAQGGVESGAAIMRAVAYDLDLLQQLTLPLSRLVDHISDIAPIMSPYWVAAASSVATKVSPKALSSSLNVQDALNMNMPTSFIQRPATQHELQAWASSISSKQEWSEGAQILAQYYHLHGFGITSRNSALRWSKGAFEEGHEGNLTLSPLSVLDEQKSQLDRNTIRFCEGFPAQHCLIGGPSGSGKSWLLWEATLIAGKDKGVRIVEIPSSEQATLLEAVRGAGRYPRIRFILTLDNVDFPIRNAGLGQDLMTGLNGGAGPSGWPTNVLLYAAASSSSTISFDNDVVSRFGLVMTTGDLTEESFHLTLEQMGGRAFTSEELTAAGKFAKTRGGLTVRNAASYLRKESCK